VEKIEKMQSKRITPPDFGEFTPESKCTCVFDNNENLVEVCKLHADWKKQAEDRVHIRALEGMIEILTNGFGKTMPPDESTVDSRALGRE